MLIESGGLDCPPTYVVPVEVAPDRAGRLNPGMVVLLLEARSRNLFALAAVNFGIRRTAISLSSAQPTIRGSLCGPCRKGPTNISTRCCWKANWLRRSCASRGDLRIRLPSQTIPREVIAVLSPSGGSGSSTVAVNVAAVLARKRAGSLGWSICGLSAGDLARPLLDLRPVYNLANLARERRPHR